MSLIGARASRPLLISLHAGAALVCATLAVGIVVWQYGELWKDRRAAESALGRQAESIHRAISGNLRSHRRLGAYFDQQIATFLEELVASQDVLGVSIVDESGREIIHAGETIPTIANRRDAWSERGFVSRREIDIPPLSPTGGGPFGPGRGFGRGRWGAFAAPEESVFMNGGRFECVILLDRTAFDAQAARMVRLRWGLIAAGVGACVLLWGGWILGLRVLALSHRKRLAELQSRHWEELSHAAAGLAHETRNPLGSIRGWAQRIAETETPSSSVASQARIIMEECDRITARINQFLSFARPYDLHLEAVDLEALFKELTTLLDADAASRDLRLDAQAEISRITADPNLLRQALFNLLHNALRYSPQGGTIELRAFSESPHKKVIEVRDRGPGVPEPSRPRLFTPYYTTSDGTGLGLAIVRRIADLHGWSVEYRPRQGGGAVFRLVISDSKIKPQPKGDADPDGTAT
ncbi:MAG: two-component system sensor histidine kinase ZraS [Thermogutta sp.]